MFGASFFLKNIAGALNTLWGGAGLTENLSRKAAETRFMPAQGLLAKTIRTPKFTRLGVPRIAHFLTV